jgi:hypothetical protein
MLKLNLARSPAWLDLLPGVRVKLAPLTTALMVAARSDIASDLPASARGAADGDNDADDGAEAADSAGTEALALAMAKALARRAVLDWEGVGDAEGAPIPVSPEGIDALLDLWPAFEAFQSRYVAGGLLLEQEKNVSAPSPTGTTAGATATARRAKAPARTARQG